MHPQAKPSTTLVRRSANSQLLIAYLSSFGQHRGLLADVQSVADGRLRMSAFIGATDGAGEPSIDPSDATHQGDAQAVAGSRLIVPRSSLCSSGRIRLAHAHDFIADELN